MLSSIHSSSQHGTEPYPPPFTLRCSRLMQSMHHDRDFRTRGIGGSDSQGTSPDTQSPDIIENNNKKKGDSELLLFDLEADEVTTNGVTMNNGANSPADDLSEEDEVAAPTAEQKGSNKAPPAGNHQKQSHNQHSQNQQPGRQDSHKIANSKLLMLLSKLDKGRGDYGYSRQKRAMRENSRKTGFDSLDMHGPCDPAALVTLAGRQSADVDTEEQHDGSRQKSDGKCRQMAASMPANNGFHVSMRKKSPPMNFKFLTQGGPSANVQDVQQISTSTSPLKRSESAPVLGEATDITFTVSNVVETDDSDPDDVPIQVIPSSKKDEEEDKDVKELIQKSLEGQVAAACDETHSADEGEKENNAESSDKNSKYRRCSSLKSGKTPPGSPGKRKIVRFADLFGLDLSEIKTICDDIPKVPKSAFQDLKNAELSDLDSDSGSDVTGTLNYGQHHKATFSHNQRHPVSSNQNTSSNNSSSSQHSSSNRGKATSSRLQPLFTQPSGTPAMLNNLRDRKVSLESAYVDQTNKLIKGIVRVVNFDFHKSVRVRFTVDDWSTSSDVPAAYLSGTCDGFSDRFSFVVDAAAVFDRVGGRLQLCVAFQCLGNEYWDSNNGGNYVFQYFAGYTPAAAVSSGSTGSSSSTSRPVNASPPGSDHGRHQSHTFSQLSNSPTTAFSDDPWLRYM